MVRSGIERRHRLLEDHGDAGAAHWRISATVRPDRALNITRPPSMVTSFGNSRMMALAIIDFAGAGFADHAQDSVRPVGPTARASDSACGRSAPLGRRTPRCSSERNAVAHRLFSLGLSASFRPWPTSDHRQHGDQDRDAGDRRDVPLHRSTSRPSPIRLPQEATLGSDSRRNASALPAGSRPPSPRWRRRHRRHAHWAGSRRGSSFGRPSCRASGRPERNSRLRSEKNSARVNPRRRRPRHHADRDGDGGPRRSEHATSTSSSTKFGSVWNASVIRIRTLSTQPP